MKEKIFDIELNPEILIEDKENFKRFLSVITAMEEYSSETFKKIDKMEKDFEKIGEKYISKFSFNYKDRINKLKEVASINQNLLNNVIKIYKPAISFYKDIDMDEIRNMRFEEGKFIYNVFTYILRDWTKERKKERQETYGLIIDEVLKYFSVSKDDSIKYKFLIPGSGLNRLGYELCKLGFNIEGNEYLFLNGLFSDYILNHSKKDEFFFYPNIDTFSNFLTEDSVFREYTFPDIDINLKKEENNKIGKFKLSIGDFISIYDNQKDCFDCVITCYFIDTGQNIIHYIDIIYNILKKGGIWINFGPLSYHWSGYPNAISIELPYDKLKEVIYNYGFEIINESFKNSTFGFMDNYMHNDLFKCINFTAKKT